MATKTKTKTTARKPATKGKPATKPAPARKGKGKASAIGKGDDARKVAKHSDGDLSTGQVRVLRALAGRKNPVTMAELKDAVGIGRENKYSASWLTDVKELYAPEYDYIRCETHPTEGTGRAAFHYSIRPNGRKALEAAERAASKRKG
jgi:hypothetical protein